jgi:hypothetical protein
MNAVLKDFRYFATTSEPTDLDLVRSAEVVRDFIENYHEKTEEDHVFPRFRKAGKMVDMVDTLPDRNSTKL